MASACANPASFTEEAVAADSGVDSVESPLQWKLPRRFPAQEPLRRLPPGWRLPFRPLRLDAGVVDAGSPVAPPVEPGVLSRPAADNVRRSRLSGPVALGESRWPHYWDAAAVSPDGTQIAAAYKIDGGGFAESRLALYTIAGVRVWTSATPVWSEGCDFHPDGSRIYCAHQPQRREDPTRSELLVFSAADGSVISRLDLPVRNDAEQREVYFGESVRVSPDGRWLAFAQQGNPDRGRVFLLRIESPDRYVVAAQFDDPALSEAVADVVAPDEVAFSNDGNTLYASDFGARGVHRFRYVAGAWIHDDLLRIDALVAGIDVLGTGNVAVSGWARGQVYIITPEANWLASDVDSIAAPGEVYELCADGRAGGTWVWATTQEGNVYAIDTSPLRDGRSAEVIANRVSATRDGIAMSCARNAGQPFLVTSGSLYTWVQ